MFDKALIFEKPFNIYMRSILHFGILKCNCSQANDWYTSNVLMIS